MVSETSIARVLAAYGADCQPRQVLPCGAAGGFSGARIWKIDANAGALCLRRWPREQPDPARLQWIHDILRHAAAGGFDRLSVPLFTLSGESFVRDAGYLWELSPWIGGKADYHQAPSHVRLSAAMTSLAEFHLAVADFPTTVESPGASRAVLERRRRIELWTSEALENLRIALHRVEWPDLVERAHRIIDLFSLAADQVLFNVASGCQIKVRLQPCIRDIWHDHILFKGDMVSGFVDFGAMQIDSVATDIARLLGSLVADDKDAWTRGLAAYSTIRPFSADELRLVEICDRSGVLLSGMAWLEWIGLEGRRFDDPVAVIGRLNENLRRLGTLAQSTSEGNSY